MNNTFFHAFHFFRYKIFSWHKYGHGIHSPFIYALVREVFMQKTNKNKSAPIEKERKRLKRDSSLIQKTDFGTGRLQRGKSYQRKISEIARTNLLPKKHAQLLQRICAYLNVQTAIELGASFGITTAYISKGAEKIISVEGCKETIAIAEEVAQNTNSQNIEFILGEFSEALDKLLPRKIDFAYVDGNHTKEATIKYFEKLLPCTHKDSVIVFNDIYLTKEMNDAWQEIITRKEVILSVDIFELGMVFFREGVRKQDFWVRY